MREYSLKECLEDFDFKQAYIDIDNHVKKMEQRINEAKRRGDIDVCLDLSRAISILEGTKDRIEIQQHWLRKVNKL